MSPRQFLFVPQRLIQISMYSNRITNFYAHAILYSKISDTISVSHQLYLKRLCTFSMGNNVKSHLKSMPLYGRESINIDVRLLQLGQCKLALLIFIEFVSFFLQYPNTLCISVLILQRLCDTLGQISIFSVQGLLGVFAACTNCTGQCQHLQANLASIVYFSLCFYAWCHLHQSACLFIHLLVFLLFQARKLLLLYK